MKKTLVILVFIVGFVIWNFILFPEKLDFTDKVKVLSGIRLAAAYKQAISEFGQANSYLPSAEQWHEQESKIEVDVGKSVVAAIKIAEVAPGSITIYYSNSYDLSIDPAIVGKTLTLIPQLDNNLVVSWSCKSTVPAKFLPASCR